MPCHSLSPVLSPLLSHIQSRLDQGGRLLIAIDGRCAAGKTTLARQFGEAFDWPAVHMDQFFLRPEQRTPQRYATPGENIDHERFLTQVLLPLRRGEALSYQPFDCRSQRFAPPIQIEPGEVTIVEGSYSCHPALWPHYDLRVFLTISPGEQLRRLTAREGAEGIRAFREKWIPLEEAYFSAFALEARCDYLLEPGAPCQKRVDNSPAG